MRKLLYSVMTLFSAMLFGQVGIDTADPTETLDVNGTVRIQNLPSDGSEINTTSTGDEGSNVFKAKKTVVADENGVLGYAIKHEEDVVRFTVRPVGGKLVPDFSDAKDVQAGCLKIRVDPTIVLGISGVYLYAKVDASCLNNGDTKTYMSLQAREDSNVTLEKYSHYWRGEVNATDWTYIPDNVLTQDTPMENFIFNLPDLGHLYKGVLTANLGTNPSQTNNDNGRNWPNIAFYLNELY